MDASSFLFIFSPLDNANLAIWLHALFVAEPATILKQRFYKGKGRAIENYA
jgi:hypothetical protein